MMSGILAKSNFNTTINYRLFVDATNTLSNRGPDDTGYLFNESFALGHKRLIIDDIDYGKQPMSLLKYHLICDSQLINKDELQRKLTTLGYKFDNNSDSETLLKLIIEYDTRALNFINGSFSFVLTDDNSLFAARDHFGVKPLYYSFINNDIIIASEIKAILKYKNEAIVDADGLRELLALGPSHTQGKTPFKGIYELEPGHFIKYNKNECIVKKYYEIEAREHKLDKEETISMVKYLLKDTCYRQAKIDANVASFVSGGIDSSIISMYVKDVKPNVKGFSLDYQGNELEYTPNKFETSDDRFFIPILTKKANIEHETYKVDLNTLADSLKTAVILRDVPGMADVDASLFLFAKKVRKTHKVSFSGEGSDEIFGGYPWFYREDGNSYGFPWLRNVEFRENLLRSDLKEKLKLKDYIANQYEQTIMKAPILETDSLETIKQRRMSYLNMKYFLMTLIDRNDKMTSGAGLEVRTPFIDRRLIEFLYNTPWEYKYFNDTEKALLREATKDILPEEIYSRKKSPFPKTRSKTYEQIVTKLLKGTLEDHNSILYTLFDKEKLNELLESEEDLDVPWYGQLMRKPQLIAYLYQIDYWFKEYNIKLEL